MRWTPVIAIVIYCLGCANPRNPGDLRTDAHGVEQLWVPPGTFTMGTADTTGLEGPAWAWRVIESELPAHPVELTSGYWIDRTEVTVASFRSFVASGGYTDSTLWSDNGWSWLVSEGGSRPAGCSATPADGHPVTCITWYEAEAYAAWRGGRLPTNAEWEYAARGPDSRIYPWGDAWDPALANVVDSDGTTPVGSFPAGASWIGALDMAGNAMEWVSDWLTLDYYEDRLMVDPTGPPDGRIKIEKGGWWGSNPFVARSAYHHFEDPPTYSDSHIGFRIVAEAKP